MKTVVGGRRQRPRETGEYLAFVRRAIRGAAIRVGEGDVEAFGELATIRNDVELALEVAVSGLRQSGVTWEQIGQATGTTRQAALMRWGPKIGK